MNARKRDKAGMNDPAFYDGSPTTAASAVNAGHKSGKRKRGVSVTKRKPKTNAHAITRNVLDSDGVKVATVRTITYRRKMSQGE